MPSYELMVAVALIVKVIAANFLAKVRRANVGRIPFSTRAT